MHGCTGNLDQEVIELPEDKSNNVYAAGVDGAKRKTRKMMRPTMMVNPQAAANICASFFCLPPKAVTSPLLHHKIILSNLPSANRTSSGGNSTQKRSATFDNFFSLSDRSICADDPRVHIGNDWLSARASGRFLYLDSSPVLRPEVLILGARSLSFTLSVLAASCMAFNCASVYNCCQLNRLGGA